MKLLFDSYHLPKTCQVHLELFLNFHCLPTKIFESISNLKSIWHGRVSICGKCEETLDLACLILNIKALRCWLFCKKRMIRTNDIDISNWYSSLVFPQNIENIFKRKNELKQKYCEQHCHFLVVHYHFHCLNH